MRNVFERTSVSRHSLLAGCALASAMAANGVVGTAHAQTALQGTPTVVAGIANINRTAALDTISVFTPETVINWSTFDNAIGGGPIVFLNAGSVALFQNDPDFNSSFTVLNRILPNDATRAIRFDGTIQTRVNGNAGGSVWFYSPGGLILGPTAFFDVGNLVLSANDIDFSSGLFTGPGNDTILFRGAAGSTSGVEIQNGARISAQLNNSYVAVVAPRVTQSGSINVDGSALLLAAEQADVRIDAGLFGIGFTVGTSVGGNAIVHDGSTTGPNPTSFNDRQQIIVSAIAKNDAVTALVGGTLGYSSAQTAFVDAGTVVLSADTVRVGGAGTTITSNAEVFANNAIVIGDSAANTRFVRNATLTSAGDITISPRPGFSVDFGLSLDATASRRLEFNADAGERITVGGSAQLFSENIGAGSGVFARAVGTGGLISVANNLRIDGGGSFAESEKLADAQLLVDGGTLTVGGNIDVDAADDVTQGLDGARSGAASFTIVNNAQVTTGGDLSVRAAGTTNFGFGQGPAAAGTAGLVVRNSTLTAGDVSVDSGSIGTLGSDSVGGNVSLLFRDSIVTLNSLQINSGASVAVSGSPPLIVDGLRSGSGVSERNGNALVQGGTARFDVINSTVTLNAGLSLTADANGVANGVVEDNVLGGSAILNIDTGTLTTASLTMSADAFANGTPPGGVAISATGGTASITTTNAALTVNGSTNISASATGAPGGPARGGAIAFTNNGVMQFNDLLTANATAQGGDGGAAFGGTTTIANNGTFASANGISLDASGFGGNGPVSGNGTGGTITLTSPAGSTLALRGSAASSLSASGVGGNANSAEDPDLEVTGSGTGQGGTISVIIGTTGAAPTDFHVLTSLALSATGAVGNANGTTATFGGAGGGAIGGSAMLEIRSGNAVSNSISISADGFAGDGGNANANVAAGAGGVGTGGNAQLLVSATDNNRFGTVTLSARGNGGLGGNASNTQAAGAGGLATGGVAEYINTGSSGANSLSIVSGAAGGGGGNGSDAFAGGVGGAARAGTSRLTVASGSIFDAISFVSGFPSLQALLTSIAVGGRGGVGAGTMAGGAGGQGIGGNLTLDLVGQFGTNGDTRLTIDTSATGGEGGGVSDGQLGGGPLGTGGAGGLARGGDVTLNVLRSALTLAGLTITTTAQGGAGGSISEGGATATGGRGGNASAGNVRFAVDVDPDIGDLEIRSDAFGGTGGDAVTGGAGGDAINATTVTFEVTDGITNVNDAFITADAQGGSGGRGLAGTGGAGGNATAGTALIAARGPTSELNITTLSLSTTGAGGTGGASTSFSTTGSGGAGGNGTGGSATVITTGGGTVALTGSSDVSAAAGGGGGGQGSPGSTPGAGGAGGSAVAGTVLVDGTSGILSINQFSSDASGSGGTGGMGGETGYGSGPGTVAGGGRGGNVTVREVGFASVDSTLFAFAEGDGGLGGNGSVGGDAGNGVGGTVVVSLTNPTGTLGQLVASASASGGSGGDGLGGNGGNATGGTATVTLITPDPGFIIGQSRVDASATGGNAASGGISGSGGNGTAGTANLTLSGGALSGTAITLRALGTGGVASNGSGNRGGPGTNGGTGGSGSGGTINLVVDDGAALTLSGDPGLVADATGTGQAGGSGGTGAGVAGVGGAGGSGTGGAITQTFADGATLALTAVEAIVNMTASGVGGAGGLGGRFGSSGGNGGAGGAGIGGSGTLNLTGANTAIPNGRSVSMTLNGTAGAGGEAGVDVVGSIGGAGGLARGGNATLSLSGATASLNELNFAVSASAGAGGNGGTGGGGAGGAATGGNIVVDAIDGASLTLAAQSLSANATGGAGGSASAASAPGGQPGAADGADGNPGIEGDRGQNGQNGLAGLNGNVGGAGGLGGDAIGGAVTLRATASSLTTGAVTVGASGTAGRGGAGGDGSAGGAGGNAGNGGNGSNAFSNGIAGGAGGNGGVGGAGGRGGDGGAGGIGGAGVGGSITLTATNAATLATGTTTLNANGFAGLSSTGGNGGAAGAGGNGGIGGNGGAAGPNASGGRGGNGGAAGSGGNGGDGAFPTFAANARGGTIALNTLSSALTTGDLVARASGRTALDNSGVGGTGGSGAAGGSGGGGGSGGPGTPFGASGTTAGAGSGGANGIDNNFVFGNGGVGGTIELTIQNISGAASLTTGALDLTADAETSQFGSAFNQGFAGAISLDARGGTATIASLTAQSFGDPRLGGLIRIDAGDDDLAITSDANLVTSGMIEFGRLGGGGTVAIGGRLSGDSSVGILLDSGNVVAETIALSSSGAVISKPGTLFDARDAISIGATSGDIAALRAVNAISVETMDSLVIGDLTTTATPDANLPFPVRPGIIRLRAGSVDGGFQDGEATITGTVTSTGDTIIEAGSDIVITGTAQLLSDNRILLNSGDDIIIRSGARLTSGRNPIPETGYGATGVIIAGAGTIDRTPRVPGSVASFIAGSATLTAINNLIDISAEAIDAGSAIFDAGRFQALIRNAPAPGAPPLDDSGQLSANCVMGNACIGQVTATFNGEFINATGAINIGPASGSANLPNAIRLDGALNGLDITVRGRDAITLGQAGNETAFNAENSLFVASLLGDVQIQELALVTGGSGGLKIYAGGNLTGSAGSVRASSDLGLFAGGGLSIGVADVGGVLQTIDSDGGIADAAALTLPGSINFGNLTVRGGDAVINGGSVGINGGDVTSGSLLVSSSSDASFGPVNASQDIRVNAGGISGGFLGANGEIVLEAGSVNFGGLSSGSTTRVTSSGSITGGDVNAGSDALIEGSASVQIGNVGSFSGNVSVIAGAEITTGNLTASNGSVLLDNGLSTAPITTGLITARNDFTINTGSDLNFGGVSVGDDIRITTTGDATLGRLTTTAQGADDETDDSNIILTVGGGATVVHAESAGNFTANASRFETGNNSIITDGDIIIDTTGDSILGTSRAGGLISVNAGGLISFSSLTSALTTDLSGNVVSGNVAQAGGGFTANAIGQLSASNVTSTRDSILLSSSNGPVNLGLATAAGDVRVFSGGLATIASATAGGDVRVRGLGAVRVGNAVARGTFINGQNQASEGHVFIIADGIATVDSANAASMLGISGAAVNGSAAGTLRAGEDILVVANGPVSLGNLSAGDDIDINVPGAITLTSATSRGDARDDRALAFVNLRGIPQFQIQTATPDGSDVRLTATGASGAINLGTANAANDLLLNASASLGSSGLLSAGGAVSLSAGVGGGIAGSRITVQDINAGTTISLNSTNSGVSARNLAAGTGIATSGFDISAVNSATTATGDIVITDTNSVFVQAAVASTGGITLSGGGSGTIVGNNLTAARDITASGASAATLANAQAGDDIRVTTSAFIDLGVIRTTGLGADNEGDGANIVMSAPGQIKFDGLAGALLSAAGNVSLTSSQIAGGNRPVTAGRAITLNGGNFVNAGALTAGADIIATAVGDIALSGGGSAGGSITARGGSFSLSGGPLASRGLINIVTSSGNLTLSTPVNAGGALLLDSANFALFNALSGNGVAITARNAIVGGSGLFTGPGTLDSTGSVTINSDVGVGISGAISAAGAITGTAPGFLLADATGSAITLTATTGGLSAANLTATTGAVTLDVAGAVTTGDILASGDAVVARSSMIDAGNIASTNGDVSLTSAGTITTGDLTAANGSVGLTNTNGPINTGTITARNDFTINTGSELTFAGISVGDDIRITTTGNATLGRLMTTGAGTDNEGDGSNIRIVTGLDTTLDHAEARGSFSANARNFTTGLNSIITGGSIVINAVNDADLGNSTAGTFIDVVAGNDLRFASLISGSETFLRGDTLEGDQASAGGLFEARGAGGVAINAITSGLSADISASGTGIALGSVEAGGSITLVNTGTQSITADVLAAGGDIAVDSFGGFDIGEARALGTFAPNGAPLDGNVFLYADGVATLNSATARSNIGVRGAGVSGSGRWVAGEDIRVLSTAGATLGALSAGDDLTLETVGQLTVASGTTTGAGRNDRGLTLFSGEGGRGWQSGTATADGSDIFLTSSAGSVAAGDQTADDDLTITAAAGSVSIGTAGAGGNLTAQAGAGPLTATGPLSAGGIAQLVGTEIGVSDVTAGANVSATSAAGALGTGNVSGGTGVALNSAGALTTGSVTAAGGNIDATAIGAAQTGALSATTGNITLTAASIATGGATAGGNIVAQANGGALSATGPMAAGGLARLNAASINVGNVSAGTSVSATSSVGSLTAGDVAGGTGVALNSAGALTTANVASTTGNIAATAVGTAQLGMVTAAAGDVTLTAGGGATIVAADAGGDLRVTAPTLTASALRASDDITVTTTGNATLGTVSGRGTADGSSAVSITAPSGIAIETMNVIGTVALNAANGAIVVARDLLASGAVTANGRAIDLVSSGALNLASALATDGNIRVTAGSLTASDAQARGDLSLTATSGDLVAGVLRTGTSVGASAGGTPGLGDITLTSARGITLNGSTNAQRNLAAAARNTLAINALATGNAVDLRSGNVAIAATATVGEQGRTTLVRLTNSANAVTTIGGAGSANGYSLSNAEAQRIFANDIIIVAPRVLNQTGLGGQVSAALNTRAPDVILEALTLTGATGQTGATAGNIGTSGRLRIETAGKLRTVGAVTLNNLGSGNRFQIAADEAIEVDAATGSISLRNAQNGLGGVLELSSADVIAATIPAISGVIGAPTTQAASDLLGASSGTSANDDGFLRADAINVTVSGGFYVQNSGAPSTNLRNFDDRRGLTVGQGGLSINTTSASTRIIVNGRQQGAGSFVTGLDFLRQVVINGGSAGLNSLVSGRFDAQSTINGCAILSVAQCNVSFDNGNIARDIIRNVVAEENGEGDGGLLPFSLVQVKDVDPLPFQPVIDDPVTGSGNDDLWAVDDGKDCPEGETCAN